MNGKLPSRAEAGLQWVLFFFFSCMHLTLSHVKLTEALRTDACIAWLVGFSFFFFSHQASRSMCLWVMGRWKRDVQRRCCLLAVSVRLSAVLSVESLPDTEKS